MLERWGAPFFAVTLLITDPSTQGARRFRVELRNRIDYLRRSPIWRNFGLLLYRAKDGTFRGIADLGGLGPADVLQGLDKRWPMTLRPIPLEDLRLEIWGAMKPAVIAAPLDIGEGISP